jgi:PTH1 family peptidyl-tRNA hydrolase
MKYLIVGLGNIGPEYRNTRHNIGFKILDALAGASNFSFDSARLAFKGETRYKGRTLICIKPTTYMNLSGKAVSHWMQVEKIKAENVLVITDDLALSFGTLRLKTKGSDGGHNGLKNIQTILGTNVYPRLRFGVGSDFQRGRQVDYVLSDWTEEEEMLLPERIEKSLEIIYSFCSIGPELTMSAFNNK